MTGVATVPKDGRRMLDLDSAKVEQRFVEVWSKGQLDKLSIGEQSQFLMAFGRKIGLRAELGEIIIYQGKPYVTLKGVVRNAHSSGLLAGVVPRPATSMEARNYGVTEGDVLWTCDVYRHGAPRPFRGWGVANVFKDRNPVAKQFPREMAKKRARYDAFAMAFPIDETLGPIHQKYIEEAEQEAVRRLQLPVAVDVEADEGPDENEGFAAVEDDTTTDVAPEGDGQLPLGDTPKAKGTDAMAAG